MWSDFLAKMIKYLGVYSVYHNRNLLMPRLLSNHISSDLYPYKLKYISCNLAQLGDGWCDGNSSGNSQSQGRDKEVISITHHLKTRLNGSGNVLRQKFVLVSSTKFALFYDNMEKGIQALSSPSALQNYFATQESLSRDINFRNLSLLSQ